MTHDQLKCALILLQWTETKYSSDPAVWKFKDYPYGLRVYSAAKINVNNGIPYSATFYADYDNDIRHKEMFETYQEALEYITENT